MKILAIETSTLLGGIAILDDSSGLIAEVKLNVKSTHSERLMTEIVHALEKTSLLPDDIDAFAVSIGPGSFTGLRIGLSTVKGFSYATGKPIVAVPTLEALSWNFPYCRYPVCTMLDARKKEVYAAVFQWKGTGFRRMIDEMSVKVDNLLEKMTDSNSPLSLFSKGGEMGFIGGRILFTGEGALLYRETLIEVMGEKALFPPADKMVPSPANVAYLGLQKAVKGEFSEPVSLVPFYVRKSEAEIKKDG
jgi:tRNA threonylcarbamoyladenosine biosynthesis protein TsaB